MEKRRSDHQRTIGTPAAAAAAMSNIATTTAVIEG
jgi:hypothetical protein